MADFTGITAAKADEILDESVVSGVINGSGHLILTRHSGEEIDAGDFTAIVSDILADQVAAAVADAVPDAIAGTKFDKGNVTGAIGASFFTGVNADNLPNALFNLTLTGNATLAVADMPANPKPNTQFVMRIKQDATGGRTLTFTGFKRSYGSVPLTATANAIDMIVFIFDGTDWYVGLMGADFK